jgi:transcriptional regulator with XRE-family HTH domain
MLLKDRIKDLRKEKNLLQKELAQKIGISKPTVSAWERGSRFPNSTQRKNLCRVFEITEAELFGGTPSKISPDILAALQDPIAVKTLLITYKNSQDVKNTIKALLETLPSLAPQKRQAIIALCK